MLHVSENAWSSGVFCEANSIEILSHPHIVHQRNIFCYFVGNTWATNHRSDVTAVNSGGSVTGAQPSPALLWEIHEKPGNQQTKPQPSKEPISFTRAHTRVHTHTCARAHARARTHTLSLSLSLSLSLFSSQ
jgi:hypothetical protein